ncbi:hypothetical protein GF373_02615 [bacterium]|nr:hypothetical protein [bacterium]
MAVFRLLIGLLVLFAPSISWATFNDTSEPVPVDRLIRNVSQYVQAHPHDAHGYYTLGRVHSYAFAKIQTAKMECYDWENKKYAIPRFRSVEPLTKAAYDGQTLSEKQQYHLKRSISLYYKATTMNPDSALYFLGLGWMLEQGMAYVERLGPPPYETPCGDARDDKSGLGDLFARFFREKPEKGIGKFFSFYTHEYFNPYKTFWLNLADREREAWSPFIMKLWKEECLWAYRMAFHKSIYRLTKIKFFPKHSSVKPIAIEAGQGIIHLIGEEENEPHYAWEVKAIYRAMETATLKTGVITPIIFSLDKAVNGLGDLLDTQSRVAFDLDGDGKASRWPWVKPDTAILVWDPEQEGTITSGKQLFGSVTWWMFWRNGYDAMDALDDNRDGWLSGDDEPRGLAVWRDANQNGRSEAGEVTPIGRTAIQAIATRAEYNQENQIGHSAGLKLKSGAILPTFDWVPERVE